MALNYATVGLDDKHDEILEELVKKKSASKTAILRQALRVLDLVEKRRDAGFELIWRKDGVTGSLDAEVAALPDPTPEPVPKAEGASKRYIVVAPTYQHALNWANERGVQRQLVAWPQELANVAGLDFTKFEVAVAGNWGSHVKCLQLLEYIRNHRTWEKGRTPLL